MEYAVFLLVRVNASSPEEAQRLATAPLEAIDDQRDSRVTSVEVEDVIEK